MSIRMDANHTLKKDFEVSSSEIYKKGYKVHIKKRHTKHEGFCCNVVFLDDSGKISKNDQGMLSLFDKRHFKPLKDWFEPIKK